jgi:hypothetical protein
MIRIQNGIQDYSPGHLLTLICHYEGHPRTDDSKKVSNHRSMILNQ